MYMAFAEGIIPRLQESAEKGKVKGYAAKIKSRFGRGDSAHSPQEAPKKEKFSTPEFKRNFFVDRGNTTEAAVKGRRRETKEQSEWVQFSENTRNEFTSFLDNYATNMHDVMDQPGGADILKAQPHSEQMYKMLSEGVDFDGTSADDVKLKANIKKMLEKPSGWVLTKELIEQETALGLFALGLVTSAEGAKIESNPDNILAQGEVKKSWRTNKGVGTGMGAGVGGTVGFGVGQALEHLDSVQQGVYNFVDLLSRNPHGTLTTTTLLGAIGGGIIGRKLVERNEQKQRDNMAPGIDGQFAMADVLDVIKEDSALSAYVKAMIKIDVNDYVIKDGDIRVVGNETTQDLKRVFGGLASNLATRESYFEDLGIPKESRDLMPEKNLLEKNGLARSQERITQRVMAKYNELNNSKDIWGQDSSNPDYRRKGPGEKPTIENMLMDKWGQMPLNPDGTFNVWYRRMDGSEMTPFPDYDPANVVNSGSPTHLLKDRQGRGISDPLFGRGEYVVSEKRWFKKKEKFAMPQVHDRNSNQARNINDKSVTNPEFWIKRGVPLIKDMSLFDISTGKDNKGRVPWDPLFCMDVDAVDAIQVQDLVPDDFKKDRWGHEKTYADGAFGIRESKIPQEKIDVLRYRQAREKVLTEMTQELVEGIESKPKDRPLATIDQKIKDRQEGGRVYEEKKKSTGDFDAIDQSRRNITALVGDVGLFPDLITKKEALTEVTKKLDTLFDEFGVSDKDEALKIIKERQFGSDPAHPDPKSIYSQLWKYDQDYQREYHELLDKNQPHDKEPDDAYWQRMNPSLNSLRQRYDIIIEPIVKDQSKLLMQKGDIENYSIQLERVQNDNRILEEKLKTFGSDYVKVKGWGIDADALRDDSFDTLLEKVNKLTRPAGWPEEENGNDENTALLWRAVIEAKAEKAAITAGKSIDSPTREQILHAELLKQRRELEDLEDKASRVDLSADISQLEVTQDLIRPDTQAKIFSSVQKIIDDPTMFDSSNIKPVDKFTQAEKEFKDARGKEPPKGYFALLNVMYAYQEMPNREEFFKKISSVVTPEELTDMFRQLASEAGIDLKGVGPTNLAGTFDRLQANKDNISRRNLRKALRELIDSVQAKALAMS